ncbi:hypothetical protein P152DRAFT_391565, partial [Eremomyces bilateralis CBS 781.70]
APNFPPPKTDKPRPHVCTTCGRSFARLEHLKRHERSHTKEKPFECPQCSRCFARRDLLLRHQQKLHQQGAASSRPRNGRRESTSGMPPTGLQRGRKGSTASTAGGPNGTGSGPMRPRANTISHIDASALNSLLANSGVPGRPGAYPNGMAQNPMMFNLANMNGFGVRGMPNGFGQHSDQNALPKLDTQLNMNIGGGLRTAPIQNMGDGFHMDKMFGSASTINPAQLHFSGGLGSSTGTFPTFPLNGTAGFEEEDNFDWSAAGLENGAMNGDGGLDGSSPSALSTASQSGFSEVMLDGSNSNLQNTWPHVTMGAPDVAQGAFSLDTIGQAIFPELIPPNATLSSKDFDQNAENFNLFPRPTNGNAMSPNSSGTAVPGHFFQPHMTFNHDTNSMSSPSVNGSGRPSSISSVSTDSITDATRQALLISLSQTPGFGHTNRKFSQTPVGSPISSGYTPRSEAPSVELPSTADLQRYVASYIYYFHPHMPFLHIPTLTFNSPAFTTHLGQGVSMVGGGGCLILAMAAIGALYEFEHDVGERLFEYSKKMISIYLEERRRSGMTSGSNAGAGMMGANASNQKTPLWLVQAMLLNLIYGHNCGNKISTDIATTHCAALVSLAKAAELDKPDSDVEIDARLYNARTGSMDRDMDLGEDGLSPTSYGPRMSVENTEEMNALQAQWYRWKINEERKRTLFCIFVLSSILVTAYNHLPRILNSEIHLRLPCEETLWGAESAQAWLASGGPTAEQNIPSFADSLSFLLTASQRDSHHHNLHNPFHSAFGSSMPLDNLPESDLKPSSFGCYVLINALHVYIWETRQRHNSRQWKTSETEQMLAQIEPALRAWQAAWRSNTHHSLERPNPYGPMPANSIPLLDLAYVRLFVNLGRSKEAFWARDFDAMCEELGRGIEIIQHADNSRDGSEGPLDGAQSARARSASADVDMNDLAPGSDPSMPTHHQSKRERHLRKAAFYAADSLQMADKLGVTFAEFTSRELPIASAMCTFDCAQVLAEWLATVQERVGRFLGVLGRDDIDYSQVPAILLLEDEDCKLLEKVAEILHHADYKIAVDIGAAAPGNPNINMAAFSGPFKDFDMRKMGYASKLLLTTAYMMEKAAVWPSMCPCPV